MGNAAEPEPAKLFVGMLAQDPAWLDRATALLEECFGPVELASDTFDFDYTDYYESEMGAGLKRRFVSFERPVRLDDIVGIKLATNDLESRLAKEIDSTVSRPVNLDPGYLTHAKVVLATTKDYSHRIYLGRGIYAEVTLHYHKGEYQPCEWTYPDYRSTDYGRFFLEMRKRL